MKGIDYSKELDVWSYGCFAHELATGNPPFATIQNEGQLVYNVKNVDVPEITGDWSDEFKDFVKCCLQRDLA